MRIGDFDPSTERAILSSFRSQEEAQGAAKKVQSLGIKDVKINSFSAAPDRQKNLLMNPITGNFESLAWLSGDTNVGSRDSGILQAASPINSGMSDGQDMITGYNWGLTVVSPEGLVERVVKVIKDAGGFT